MSLASPVINHVMLDKMTATGPPKSIFALVFRAGVSECRLIW